MDAIDNFLIGKNKLFKYIVDTTKRRYCDTNYYAAEFFPQFIKRKFDLDIKVGPIPLKPDFPQTHRVCIPTKIGNFNLICGGSSFDYSEATSKAIGEFLERVSSFKPWTRTAPSKKYIAKSLVRSLSYGVFEKNEVYWGGAQKMINGVETTTNGCGGGFTKNMAIVSGWLELIERDGFFVHWLNTFAPRKIDVDSYVETIRARGHKNGAEADLLRLHDLLIKYKIKLHALDTTTDIGVPSICSVIEVTDEADGKQYAIGGSAGYEPAQQMISATLEAIAVLRYVYGKPPHVIPEDYVPFSDRTIDIPKRTNLYRCAHNNSKFDFFISSPEMVSVEEWSGELELGTHDEVLGHLTRIFKERSKKDAAFNVFVYEFSNDALKDLSYHVVRVICRGLYPIYLREHHANPQHPRLRQFATAIGKEREAVLNIWPHPFP